MGLDTTYSRVTFRVFQGGTGVISRRYLSLEVRDGGTHYSKGSSIVWRRSYRT